MLEVRDISKSFGGNEVLTEISFDLNQGETVGLIGPNGAGKTTLFNVISGFLRSKTGSIRFNGTDISQANPEDLCAAGLCRTFQITKPFAGITVTDNVTIGALARVGKIKQAREKALGILEFTGLYEKRNALGKSLTIPDRKRLEIARALATEPKLLLLDEVMAGLNHQELDQVMELLNKVRERGSTLFIIEHIMGAIMKLSDRIIALDYGRMLCQGSPESVTCDPAVIKAYLGEEYVAATS